MLNGQIAQPVFGEQMAPPIVAPQAAPLGFEQPLMAPPMAPPVFDAPMAPPPLANDEAAFRPTDIDELRPVDYRWFRYSPAAVPCLILMFLIFAVLLGLTFWQGDFSIRSIRAGIPRDLEPRTTDADGDLGVPESNQKMRLAAASIALILCLNQIVTMCSRGFKNKIVTALSGVTALGFFVAGILAIIAFVMDVSDLEDVFKCRTEVGSNRRQSCENQETLMTVTAVIDACLAALCIVGALLAGACGKFMAKTNVLAGITANPSDDEVDKANKAHTAKCLMSVVLVATFIFACLAILFSVLLAEIRERVYGREFDPISNQMNNGWPKQNSRLRATATIAGIILVLLTLVPFPHRVYAYLLGLAFFILAILFFVCFGLDLKDINDAHDLNCPGNATNNVDCEYDPYNATIAFDFLAGLFALFFVLIEFIGHKKKSYVQARSHVEGEDIDDYDLSGSNFLGASANDQFGKLGADAPARGVAGAQRPVIGVEVVEMEHPTTGELAVTVVSVAAGSASEEAGLRVGDIISRWNQAPIFTKADFAAAIRDTPINSAANLQIQRQGPGMMGSAVDYVKLVVRGAPL